MNVDIKKLSQPFIILLGMVILSYFTNVAWWALSGLSYVIAVAFTCMYLHSKQSKLIAVLCDLFLIIAPILFICGVIFTRWTFF
jgi:hypothetical protein